MEAKVTLSLNAEVISDGKLYAKGKGITLSRLTEILLLEATMQNMPIANWVKDVSEGSATYTVVDNRKRKNKYHSSKLS